MAFSYASFFNCCNLKKYYSFSFFSPPSPPLPLELAHLPCFKILWIIPTLTSKVVHENSTTNIDYNAPKTTLSKAWKVRGKTSLMHQWKGKDS